MSAVSLLAQAERLLFQREFQKAHRILVRSLSYPIDPFLKADILSSSAEALRALGRFRDSLRDGRRAESLYRRLGVLSERVSARLGISACLRIVGSYKTAEKLWRDLSPIIEKNLSRSIFSSLRAEVELEKALVARGLGRFSETRVHLGLALKFLRRCKKKDRIAKVQHAHWILGGVERFSGRFARSSAAFKKAAALARVLGDQSAEAFALCGLAGVQRVLGFDRASFTNYRRAHRLLSSEGDPFGRAYGLCGQANALRTFGPAADCIRLYRQSARLYQRLGDKSSEGFAHWGLGGSYRRLKQFSRSWVSYQKALRLFVVSKDDRGVIMAHLGLARWWEDRGFVPQALRSVQRASAIARKAGLSYESALAQYEQGRILHPSRPPVKILKPYGISASVLARWRDVP